jgi:uncharacterized protein (TIGR02266 family)
MSDDRRSGPRVPVQMWVEESSPDGLYFQRSANLSPGGMYLENTVPHPVGTLVNLKFTLPDGGPALEVRGEIVNAATDEQDFGMGLRFVDLPAETAERIARYVGKPGA